MPDPLAEAKPGSLSPFVNDRATVNAVLESARRERARRNDLGNERAREPLSPACRVLVRNDTGSDLPSFSVLTLGEPIISAIDFPHEVRRDPLFPGTAPAATTDVIAVTIEPIAEDGIGRAVIMGAVPCDISVSDAAHTHAVPIVSTTLKLASATSGPARIIWKESGTGSAKRSVVLLTEDSASSSSSTSSPWLAPVRVRHTIGNGTAIATFVPGYVADGVTLAANDRILLWNLSTATDIGIWVVSASGPPTRPADAALGADILGATVLVLEGTLYHDTFWTCINNGTAIVGTDTLDFRQTPFADTNIAGYVSTDTQTFAGAKTFNDTVRVEKLGTFRKSLIAFSQGTGWDWLDDYYTVNPLAITVATTQFGSYGAGLRVAQKAVAGEVYLQAFAGTSQSVDIGGRPGGYYFGGSFGWTVYSPGFVRAHFFSAKDASGTFYDGVTGTLSDGTVVSGGIVTTLGSAGAGITSIGSSTPTSLTGYLKGNGSVCSATTTIPNTDITGLGTLATQSGTFSGTHSGTSSGTNTGDQTITLTGDVTGSGTGSFATTIAAGVVTNAMLAGSIASSKLVGTDIATVGTITSGTWTGTTIAIANGGTGQTTANAAANALLPSQTGNNGKYLKTDGTDTSWATATTGITTIDGSTPTSLTGILTGNGTDVDAGQLSGDVTTTGSSLAVTIGAGKVTNSMLAGSIDLTSKVTGVLPAANGGTAVMSSAGFLVKTASQTLTGTATYQDVTDLSVTLPAAGTYWVSVTLYGAIGGPSGNPFITAVLNLNGSDITDTDWEVVLAPGGPNYVGTATFATQVVAAGAHVLKVRAKRSLGGGPSFTVSYLATDANGKSTMSWFRQN